MIGVRFPLRLEQSQNSRTHWRKRAERRACERAATANALNSWTTRRLLKLAKQGNPSGRWVVTLTRIAPRPLDDDNLSGRLKGVRDQVAAWLGLDDRGVRFICHERRGAVREHAVDVAIRSEEEYVRVMASSIEEWGQWMKANHRLPSLQEPKAKRTKRARPASGPVPTPNFRAGGKK